MKLVSSKSVGQRRVYDIEVDQVHNFFANGVNVHNCATAGGVSVIKHDGTVVNSSATGSYKQISITKDRLFAAQGVGVGSQVAFCPLPTTPGFVMTAYSSGSIPALALTSSDQAYLVEAKPSQVSVVTQSSLKVLKENPTTPTKGMVSYITNAYTSGYQVGDSRGAWLSDTIAETIAGTELVVNGGFDTAVSGWSTNANTSIAFSSGSAVITSLAGATVTAYRTVTGIQGKWVRISCSYSGLQAGRVFKLALYTTFDVAAVLSSATSGVVHAYGFVPVGIDPNINAILSNATAAGETVTIDNISVKLADPDRSVKNNGLSIVGSLTKTPVAVGAQLVAYSGFSAANYLEQPWSANLDFGTGDFCVMGWMKGTATGGRYFARASSGSGANRLIVDGSSGLARVFTSNAAAATVMLTGGVINDNNWHFICAYRASGVMALTTDGGPPVTTANTHDITNTSHPSAIGNEPGGTGPFTFGSLALWRTSATAPSADQIAQIYRDELPLFQPNAQCTIAGTSTAVTALAYDESTDLLHVGTSWGRSAFKGLLRTESEATTTGPITSLSAAQGAVLTGGTSAKIYQPALQLRDELARKEEAKRALGKVPVFIDITATASQTAFVLAAGYTIKALYRNGTLMRETTTGVFWQRSFDGYRETATLSVGATVGDWISLMCVRSN